MFLLRECFVVQSQPVSLTGQPSARISRWPLFLAPLVTAVYYLALIFAFAHSIEAVVGDASDVAPLLSGGPTWGGHWLYRAFAEAVSISFAMFVAGGIARERGRLAGLIGGLSISTIYLLRNLHILYVLFYLRADQMLVEPWYQHIIEGLLVVGAPFVGIVVGELGGQTACSKPDGFAGIDR